MNSCPGRGGSAPSPSFKQHLVHRTASCSTLCRRPRFEMSCLASQLSVSQSEGCFSKLCWFPACLQEIFSVSFSFHRRILLATTKEEGGQKLCGRNRKQGHELLRGEEQYKRGHKFSGLEVFQGNEPRASASHDCFFSPWKSDMGEPQSSETWRQTNGGSQESTKFGH